MDCVPEKHVVIDIESPVESSDVGSPGLSNDKIGNMFTITIYGQTLSADEPLKGGISTTLLKTGSDASPDAVKNVKKDKRKTMSAKRPPKPPRPPRGLSLDAADQKLIREIAELAMIKRARIERMKALKKMKAAKASSGSASSSGNLLAMLFTLLFCVIVVFQGCHSSGISSTNNTSGVAIPASMQSTGVTEGSIIALDGQLDIPFSSAPGSGGSPNLIKLDGKYEER